MESVEIKHGVTAYAKGKCRCADCKLAWRTYMRGFRGGKRRSATGVFKGRASGLRVKMTALAVDIARAAAIREGRTIDDIMEAAVRSCAPRLRFQ